MVTWSNKIKDYDIILVSLGGASGFSNDYITYLARDIKYTGKEIYRGYGVPSAGTQYYQAYDVAVHIKTFYDYLKSKNKIPKVILVGKSMGGCILHKATWYLSAFDIDVDLFIGVDMSCWVACHYKKYPGDAKQVRFFFGNVKKLINFYQTKDYNSVTHVGHCGHPAIYVGSSLNEQKININVNESLYDVIAKERVPKSAKKGKTCKSFPILEAHYKKSENVNNVRKDTYSLQLGYSYSHIYELCHKNTVKHMDIDTCTGLISTIKRLIKEYAGLPTTDSANIAIMINGNKIKNDSLLIAESEKTSEVTFEVGNDSNEHYERKVTVNLGPNNKQKTKTIKLKKPFTCISPRVKSQSTLVPLVICHDHLITIGKNDYTIPNNTSNANINDRKTNSNRILFVRNSDTPSKDNSFVSEIVGQQIDNPGLYCGTPPEFAYKWGFVNVPIKCHLKAVNFIDVIPGKFTVEQKTNNGNYTKIDDLSEILVEDEDDYKTVRAFKQVDFDDDLVLRCSYTVTDKVGQKDKSVIYLYAKSIIKYQKAVPNNPVITFDDLLKSTYDDLMTNVKKNRIRNKFKDEKTLIKKVDEEIPLQLKSLVSKPADIDKLDKEFSINEKQFFECYPSLLEFYNNKEEVIKEFLTSYFELFKEYRKKRASLLDNFVKKELQKKIITGINSKTKTKKPRM